MHKTLISVVALTGLAAAAGAAQAADAVVAGDIDEPMLLTSTQMDTVTAGQTASAMGSVVPDMGGVVIVLIPPMPQMGTMASASATITFPPAPLIPHFANLQASVFPPMPQMGTMASPSATITFPPAPLIPHFANLQASVF